MPNGNGNGNGSRLKDMTFGDFLSGLKKYQPFIATVVGIFLIVQFLPGKVTPSSVTTGPIGSNEPGVEQAAPGEQQTEEGGVVGLAEGPAVSTGGSGGTLTRAVQRIGDAQIAPDCDTKRGRIKIPSIYAPNCVPMWPKGADNGGATYTGVTKDTVKVVIYVTAPSASNRALAAAGTSDSPEQQDQNRKDMIEAYEAHFETYGRHVVFERYTGTGAEDDDVAAKRDALEISNKKPFAVFGGPTGTNVFVEELVARKIICMCTVSQPIDNYLKWAPYVWSDLMASSQGYLHRTAYVGRIAGRNAIYAGQGNTGANGLPVDFTTRKRSFAAVYYETPDFAYKAGLDFFEQRLKDKYGITLCDRVPTKGAHIDAAGAAQEAGTIAARLKSKECTTVLWLGDPLYPAVLTKEATRQNYFPEWMITGAALSDLVFFARTYDQAQWAHAFGISYLTVPVTEEVSDAEKNLWEWHHGRDFSSAPSALGFGRLYTAMHLAGPKLNPFTFRDGMFSYKPTGGFITQFAVSYGTGRFPWPDYLAADDAAELWWDPDAVGPDHQGANASGMYRYVDKGKRYLWDQWPTTAPKAFIEANTVTIYDERPKQDEHPEYEHTQDYRAD